jgi:hypothetical protein
MAVYGTLDVCAGQVGDWPHSAAAIDFLKGVLDGSNGAAKTTQGLAPGQIDRINLAGPYGCDAYAPLQHPSARRPPTAEISATVRSPASAQRSMTATRAPSRAKHLAVTALMPCAPPVISATLPDRRAAVARSSTESSSPVRAVRPARSRTDR